VLRVFLALAAFLFAATATQARDIFVLVGQSNIDGRGDLSQLPAFPNAARVSVFKNGAWGPGAEPVSPEDGAGAGPGMAFANKLAALRPTSEIGLVSCSRGNTMVAEWRRDWRPAASWYGRCLSRVEAAVAPTDRIAGLIFYLGESDATATGAVAFSQDVSGVLAAFRQDLGVPALPIIVTRLGPSPYPALPKFFNWSDISLVLGQFAGRHLKVVSPADLPVQSDLIHLTTAGYVTLGERYADAMHALMGE
jgi:Carbohydrate esterase, sialic acid-specific acetylesterase